MDIAPSSSSSSSSASPLATDAAAADGAGVFRKLHPEEYYRSFLGKAIRPDGRTFDETRPMTITAGALSTADGSAMIRLGHTTVLVGVQLELAQPSSANPGDGLLEVTVHLPPLCSQRYAVGKPPARAIGLGETLGRLLTTTRALQLKDLCIEEGKHAWMLHCDLVCLEDDGNVPDAALIGLLGALLDVKVPSAEVDEDGESVTVDRDQCVPLRLSHLPVPASFGLFDGQLITDPTAEEEDLMDTTFTVIRNASGKICAVDKKGGKPVPPEILTRSLTRCAARVQEVTSLVGFVASDDSVEMKDAIR